MPKAPITGFYLNDSSSEVISNTFIISVGWLISQTHIALSGKSSNYHTLRKSQQYILLCIHCG